MDNPDGTVSIDVGKMKLVTLDEASELRAEVAKLRGECESLHATVHSGCDVGGDFDGFVFGGGLR